MEAQIITNGKLRPEEETLPAPGSPESESRAFSPSQNCLQIQV